MAHILVVYASEHGHSRTVAARVVHDLRQSGHVVSARNAREPIPDELVEGQDAFIVGGALHVGNHDVALESWVTRHAHVLNTRPSAFFSVSLAAASSQHDVARESAQEFLDETGWRPQETLLVAGALQYPAYDMLTRMFMRGVARKAGLPTDTSKVHVFTDWASVEGFARRFSDALFDVRARGMAEAAMHR